VVRQKYVSPQGEPDEIRVWHSLPVPASPTGRAWIPLEEIWGDEILTQQLKRQMEFDWRALLRRYRHFEAFIKMVRRDLAREGGDGDGGEGSDGDGGNGNDDDDGDEPLAVGDE
jgi:hypothetical protein